MTNQNYLQVATAAAKESGKLFKQFFGKPKTVSMKNGNPRDQVTEVDLKIERQIRAKIKKNFPTHKIIGEEYGKSEILKNDFIWIIDPIDGTNNFIQGIPLCCISIALWQNERPVVAVIYDPITGQMFTAAKGKGTFLNGKRISASNVAKVEQGLGGLGWSQNLEKAKKMFSGLIPFARKLRALGTHALQLAYVAAGIYDYYIINEVNIWDVAAGILLITEAGGKITDWKGKPINLTSKELVATNGKMQQQLLNKLKTIR